METQWSSEDWAETAFHWSPLTRCRLYTGTYTFTHFMAHAKVIIHTHTHTVYSNYKGLNAFALVVMVYLNLFN